MQLEVDDEEDNIWSTEIEWVLDLHVIECLL